MQLAATFAGNLPLAAASIEARIRDMQRKLTAIAEIPKILSSTLATVAQTFDKLMLSDEEPTPGYAHRKWSYDEDAFDYELNTLDEQAEEYADDDDDENDDDEDEDVADENDGDDVANVEGEHNLSLDLSKCMKDAKLKDVTPESDYASEANYAPNELSDAEYDVAVDDDETASAYSIAAEEEDDVEDLELEEEHEEQKDQIEHVVAATGADDDHDDDDGDDDEEDVVTVLQHVDEAAKEHVAAAADNSAAVEVKQYASVEEQSERASVGSETVYYLKLPAAPNANEDAFVVENDGTDDNVVDDDSGNEQDNDFLSATYTWNMRNVPKLRLNGIEHDVCDLTLSAPAPTPTPASAAVVCQQDVVEDVRDVVDVVVAVGNDDEVTAPKTPQAVTEHEQQEPEPEPTPEPEYKDNVVDSICKQQLAEPTHKLLFKMDNLERAWPWADRAKIIYKQSTCHLVPRKPLGLVEQRKQLLNKQQIESKLENALSNK